MLSPLHYWPVCHRELMGSSTVRLMGNASRGIFFFLCMAQWEDEKLPSDDAKLKHLIQATARDWREFKEFLDHCFPICDDGFRRNSWMADDRSMRINQVLTNRENGKKGGRPAKVKPIPKQPRPEPVGSLSVIPDETQIVANREIELELESKLKKETNASFFGDLITRLYEIPGVSRCGKQTESMALSLKKLLETYPWVPKSEWERIAESAIDGARNVSAWKENGTATITPRQIMEKQIAFEKRGQRFMEEPVPERPFGTPLEEDEEASYFDEEDGVWRSLVTRRVVVK